MVFHVIQPGRNHTEKDIERTVKAYRCCSSMDKPGWQFFWWICALASVGGMVVSIILYQKYTKEVEEYWDNYDIYDSGTSPTGKQVGALLGIVFSAIILATFWIWRFIMSFCGTRASGLRKMKSVGYLVPYVESLRTAKPVIRVHSESYHWETRTRTVTTYVNGVSQTRTETYQEKVTTHRESNEMFIQDWLDVSPPLDSHLTLLLLEVYFNKMFTHLDPKSEEVLESVKTDMTRRNKPRDTHFTLGVDLSIEGYSQNKLFCLDESRIPWYANSFWWAMANITLMWFPYEMAFRSNLATSQFDILKQVRITGTVDPLPKDDGCAAPESVLYLQLPGSTHATACQLILPGQPVTGPTMMAPNGHLYQPQIPGGIAAPVPSQPQLQPLQPMAQPHPQYYAYPPPGAIPYHQGYPQNYIPPMYQHPPPQIDQQQQQQPGYYQPYPPPKEV